VAWGILANAVTTAIAASAYGTAAVAARRRQRRLGAASALPLLFSVVALYLLVASLRQFAAWQSTDHPSWVDVDRALYYVVVVPAALAIVPHMQVVSLVAWGKPRLAALVALVFLAVAATGIAFVYVEGIHGPETSEYGTDWTINSPVTKLVLLGGIMLPGLVGSAALITMAGGLDAAGKRRVSLVGWSMAAYFAVFTLDAFGLTGLSLLGARLATAGTGALAWWAYREPSAKGQVYAPPLEPDQMMYERVDR
jgi:hypothetical protein